MPRPYRLVEDMPGTVTLDALPPRIARMIVILLQHQQVLCAYEQGALELHFNGPDVKPQLVKVPLNSQRQ
jgi:hypothetical protein